MGKKFLIAAALLATVTVRAQQTATGSYDGHAVVTGIGQTNPSGEALTVYLRPLATSSFGKGQHFYVYRVQDIAGEEGAIKVGKLKATKERRGEEWVCRVTKGGSAIVDAWEVGDTLFVTAYEVTTIGDVGSILGGMVLDAIKKDK